MKTRREQIAELFPRSVAAEDFFLDPPKAQGEPLPGQPEMEAELFPEELQAIARAVPKRRREFAVGRAIARRALAQLGVEAGPMPPNRDRSTPWPKGVVGSITHTDAWCAVAVAWSRELVALGIDAEPLEPVRGGILRRICTEAERKRLDDAPLPPELMARVIFSAKEAFYKAQYPLTHSFVGFHDVEVDVDLDLARRQGGYRLRWVGKPPTQLSPLVRIDGRIALLEDTILSTAYSVPDAPASDARNR